MKKYLILFFLSAISVLGQEKYDDFQNLGNTYLEEKEYNKAIEAFNKSIESNNENASLYFSRGEAKRFKSDFQGAILDFNKAISIDNMREIIFISRADCYSQLKMFDKALEDYNSAIVIKPTDYQYYIRGIYYNQINNFELAIKDFTKAIEYNPFDKYSFFYRGISKINIEDYNGGIADLNTALALKTNELENLYFYRGTAYYKLQKHIEAISEFDKFIELNTSKSEAYYLRGHSKALLKKYEESILDFSKAIELNNPELKETLHYFRGIAYFKLNKYSQALIDFDICTAQNTNEAQVYYYKYTIYSSQENYNEGLENLKIFKQLDTTNYINVDQEIGYNFIKLKRYEEAKESYETFLLNEPENSIALNNYGYSLYKLNQKRDALVAFEKSFSINEKNPYTNYYLAKLYGELSQKNKACEQLDFAIKNGYTTKYEKQIIGLFEKNCK